MNITEASTYQDSFDAIEAGTATDAQCKEVIAVVFQLRGYLQEAELRAKALPQRRDAYLSLLSDDAKAAIGTIVKIDDKTEPRISLEATAEAPTKA